MALLASIAQNKPWLFRESTRAYYGKFPVKIQFELPGGPATRTIEYLAKGQHLYLNSMFDFTPLGKFNIPFKSRVEKYRVSFFVTCVADAEKLIEFIKINYPSAHKNTIDINKLEDYLCAVEYPLSNQRVDDLLAEKIFRKGKFDYAYKVIINYSKNTGLTKKSVAELIRAINEDDDNFHLTDSTARSLTTFGWLYNCYYYCKNLDHLIWVKLQNPDFIKKIHEVVVTDA